MMENDNLIDSEYNDINQMYDECLEYLKNYNDFNDSEDPDYESIKEKKNGNDFNSKKNENYNEYDEPKIGFKVINELKSTESINSLPGETKSERLRRLSKQLPKIIITNSYSSLERRDKESHFVPVKSGFKTPPSRKR